MKLGKKIQYYRKQKLLSQEALGKLLFVTRQTVSLWEKDQTLPSLDNIVRLADIFGITVDELLSDRVLEESSESVPHVGADADCGTDAAPEIQTAAESGNTARDSLRGSKGKLGKSLTQSVRLFLTKFACSERNIPNLFSYGNKR